MSTLPHVILLVNTSSSRLHPIVMGSQRNNGSILEWQTCKELQQQYSMEPFFRTHFDLTLPSGDKENKAVMKERLYILLECDLHLGGVNVQDVSCNPWMSISFIGKHYLQIHWIQIDDASSATMSTCTRNMCNMLLGQHQHEERVSFPRRLALDLTYEWVNRMDSDKNMTNMHLIPSCSL